MRNSALAGQLAVTAFSAHPAAALPCALSACVHTVLGTLAALYFKLQDGAADGQHASAAAGEQRSSSSSSSGSESSSGGGGGGGGGGSPPGGPEEPFSALLEAVEMVARQVAPLAQRASAQLAPLAAAATSTLTAAKTTTRAGVHAALQAGASLLVPGLMEELEGQLKGLEQAELDAPPQAEGERGRPGIKVRVECGLIGGPVAVAMPARLALLPRHTPSGAGSPHRCCVVEPHLTMLAPLPTCCGSAGARQPTCHECGDGGSRVRTLVQDRSAGLGTCGMPADVWLLGVADLRALPLACHA